MGKDLETELPPGITLGCVLTREDARDVLILGDTCLTPDPADPLTPTTYWLHITGQSVLY